MSDDSQNLAKPTAFLRSALSESNPFVSTSGCLEWLAEQRTQTHVDVQRVPFSRLREWSFDTITGFALQADAKTSASQPAAASHFVVSDNNEVAFTRVAVSDVGENFRVQKLEAGTCSFSLLIYGD